MSANDRPPPARAEVAPEPPEAPEVEAPSPRRARRALAFGCAAALSLCVCSSLVVRRGLEPGPYAPPPPRRGDGLRILTWNVGTMDPRAIRMPDDAAGRVAEVIVDADADLVVLQEIASEAQAEAIIDDLEAAGGGSAEAWQDVLWVPDAAHPDGHGLVLSRRPLGWKPKLPDFMVSRHAPATGLGRNGVLRRHPPAGLASVETSELSVLLVHAPPRSATARAELFRYARDGVRAIRALGSKRPAVIVGDFNLDPDGRHLASLIPGADPDLDAESFALLLEQYPIGTGPTPTTAYGLRFDHVRATQGAIVAEHVIRGARRYPQDHDPLLVELCLHVAAGEPPCADCR